MVECKLSRFIIRKITLLKLIFYITYVNITINFICLLKLHKMIEYYIHNFFLKKLKLEKTYL